MADQSSRGLPTEMSSQARANGVFRPTPAQWNAMETAPAIRKAFRLEFATEGKIAVNEDRATPVFSPYAGRVMALQAKPGETVVAGQPLFVIEATDTVQGLNDFITALSTLNSARSKLNLAQIVEKRANDLYAGKAVPLKDWQQAEADLAAAQNDFRSAETAVEAVRKRLRILGRSDEEITAFQETRQIKADTPIFSPIGGVVVQRKVGPGQYLTAGATDPAFVIGDLSSVWLTAFIRETDAANVSLGQSVSFRVPAAPAREFRASVDYVASALDPATRRLLVRATVDNSDGILKPEMFANVTLYADLPGKAESVAVPREAVIYEGENAKVWVVRDDQSIELRRVKLGLTNDSLIQVLSGVEAGEKVITRGALFIDRAATGS
ncbi:MAG: efflux RND transporter periplasmic adaptor subunit [Bradyrhizobium sp.]|nr:efflux RND transporter periplasmic adaptor subunit [Bradyrhizobium sp.]